MAGMDMGMGDAGADPGAGLGAPDDAGEGDYEPKDDFEREAKDFLDDTLPMESRIGALKEAIKLCTSSDYGDKGDEGGSEKPGGGLALIFGKGKK